MTRILAIAIAALLVATPAGAAEIRVVSGGAVQEAVLEAAHAFEKKTGHKIVGTFGPMGTIQNKLKAGEKADLVLMTKSAMDATEKDGVKLQPDRKAIGRVMIGLAVKEGAPVPDIKTVDGFKAALLAAKSVAYVDPASGATSGTHFAKMLEKMGIAEQVNRNAKLKPGGYVVELVAKGEADIGIHQISEILPVKGVKLVGPIPTEVNLVSTYLGALTEGAPPEAKAFLDYLTGPEAAKIIEHAGLAPGAG